MRPRSLWIGAATALVLATAGWIGIQKMAGPRLDAYQVAAQPLVQTVVATGRITTPEQHLACCQMAQLRHGNQRLGKVGRQVGKPAASLEDG